MKLLSIIHRNILSRIKNWWWFSFAFFLTLLFGLSFIGGIIQNIDWTLLERLGISLNIVSLLVFWGLGLQKPFFHKLFWRLFLFFNILVDVLNAIFGEKYDFSILWCVIVYIIMAIVYVPYYIGLFIYAFKSRQIWEIAEDKPNAANVRLPNYRKSRRKRFRTLLKLYSTIILIILCLTLIPLVIRNNRVIYPDGNFPQAIRHMIEYRRNTIPELREFERLFPDYLYNFYVDKSVDTFDFASDYADPNSFVGWELIAGLYNRYVFVMSVDIVFARIDPVTKKVLFPGSHKEPEFSLWQVDSVSVPLVFFGRRYALTSRHSIKILSNEEWKRLVEARGDFSALGIQLEQNAPVRNFEFAYRNNR